MSGHASKIGNDVSQTQAPTVTRLSHTWAWESVGYVQQFDFLRLKYILNKFRLIMKLTCHYADLKIILKLNPIINYKIIFPKY